jgi:hypothetical protein
MQNDKERCAKEEFCQRELQQQSKIHTLHCITVPNQHRKMSTKLIKRYRYESNKSNKRTIFL